MSNYWTPELNYNLGTNKKRIYKKNDELLLTIYSIGDLKYLNSAIAVFKYIHKTVLVHTHFPRIAKVPHFATMLSK